ncbi:hypothetical protein [Shewanella xiamenensis]|uniref:Uncharacterized protein n=2 Tax=Shewanella TaxID=22 RepID=A0AAE4PYY4_9GAMM|nr:hypothetical protein [Shewanella xiamenensis]MDV5389704.1 hypothetical protein [Shewanella xiamenensis]
MEREIYKYVDANKWSAIAVDAAMNSIKDNGLIRIFPTSKTINLTDKGKEVAVNCGLA